MFALKHEARCCQGLHYDFLPSETSSSWAPSPKIKTILDFSRALLAAHAKALFAVYGQTLQGTCSSETPVQSAPGAQGQGLSCWFSGSWGFCSSTTHHPHTHWYKGSEHARECSSNLLLKKGQLVKIRSLLFLYVPLIVTLASLGRQRRVRFSSNLSLSPVPKESSNRSEVLVPEEFSLFHFRDNHM